MELDCQNLKKLIEACLIDIRLQMNCCKFELKINSIQIL